MTMNIRAVIWDMGGVLVRTEDANPRLQLAKRLGKTRAELETLVFDSKTAIRATLGLISEKEHWDFVQESLGLDNEQMFLFQQDFWGGDRLDLQLIQAIRILRPAIKTGLLSNAWSGARQEMQRQFGFLDVFDVSIFSAEVKLAKPDPRIYSHMLNQLQVEAQDAIFIDDVVKNVEAARGIGIFGIHFRSPEQTLADLGKITCHD